MTVSCEVNTHAIDSGVKDRSKGDGRIETTEKPSDSLIRSRRGFSPCHANAGSISRTFCPGFYGFEFAQGKDRFCDHDGKQNWTGNNAGASFGDPDLKDNPLAPYINGELFQTSAHPQQYFNPPGNHPSQPNYVWLEAGTNFGVVEDTQPGQPQFFTQNHLVRLLQNAQISWKVYGEPDFGSSVFDTCPLDFSFLDVEHLAQVYFNDVNDGLNSESPECIAHVVPLQPGDGSCRPYAGALQHYHSEPVPRRSRRHLPVRQPGADR